MARRGGLLYVDPDTPWASLPAHIKLYILDKVTEMEDDEKAKLIQEHTKAVEAVATAVAAYDWKNSDQLLPAERKLQEKLSKRYGVQDRYSTERGAHLKRVRAKVEEAGKKEETRKRNVRKVLTGKIKKATR